MDMNKFTIKTQQASQRAVELAGEYKHVDLEPEHLLAAIIEDHEGLPRQIAVKVGQGADSVSGLVTEHLSKIPAVLGDVNYGDRASGETSKLFQAAVKESRQFKDEYLSLEHIFLAYLKGNYPLSPQLKSLGLEYQAVKQIITQSKRRAGCAR